MARPYDENLPEVVPDSSPQALSQEEYFKAKGLDGGDGKYPYGPGWDGEKYTADPSPISPASAHAQDAIPGEARPKRVCGLGKRLLWVIAGVFIIVIIGVAVGVGVGVSQNSRGNGEAGEASDAGRGSEGPSSLPATLNSESTTTPAPTPTSASTSFETPPPTSASSTKSSPSPSPTIVFLNNQTEPESRFAFQAYSHPNYGGRASDILESEGFIDLPFDATSYVWIRNETKCCLTFCQGTNKDIGYWCESRRQPESWSSFDRVYIWCEGDPEKEKNKCSARSARLL